jgi:hypothetical protein
MSLVRGGSNGVSQLAHLRIDAQGFAWMPQEDFVGHFVADVKPVRQAKLMYAVQSADKVSAPPWRTAC